MGEVLKFDYYYGAEAEQFSFYRVPRLLIKDKRFSGLSSDAKLLYGLMLDRMALSVRNGWFDEENRAYIIYKVEDAAEDLCCCRATAIKAMAELDEKSGIGLIEKKKFGLGKPDIIYVKNFVGVEIRDDEELSNTDKSTEVKNLDFKKSKKCTSGSLKNRLQEVKETDFQKSKSCTSGSLKSRPLEVKNLAPNYNNSNYTEVNYTNPNHTEPIRMDGQDSPSACSDKQTEGNTAAEYALYEQIIRDNVCYGQLCEEYPYRVAEIDEIIRLITDTVCIRRETVRINKTDYPHEIVRGIFLKLGYEHVEFVMAWLKENPVNIANIKNYILTMLYNTYNTLYNRLSADVNYDLHGGWMDRGGRDNKARDGNY